jgi:hypothetical protein
MLKKKIGILYMEKQINELKLDKHLNEFKMKIVKSNIETINPELNNLINNFINSSIKCVFISDLRKLLMNTLFTIKKKKPNMKSKDDIKDAYNFLLDIYRDLIVKELQLLYTKNDIEIIKNFKFKEL